MTSKMGIKEKRNMKKWLRLANITLLCVTAFFYTLPSFGQTISKDLYNTIQSIKFNIDSEQLLTHSLTGDYLPTSENTLYYSYYTQTIEYPNKEKGYFSFITIKDNKEQYILTYENEKLIDFNFSIDTAVTTSTTDISG